jgi:multidrug resistance protein, MATE family
MTLDIGYRKIFSMALPLMGASFIQSIVLITDSAFLSRYSNLAFDASGNAGLIYITLFVALQGIGDGSQIKQARRVGEKRLDQLGQILGTTIWTNLILALVLFIFIQFFMSDALKYYSKNTELALAQGTYIRIRSNALFFAAFTLGANAFLLANGQTTKVFIAAVLTALSNVFLDYGMIFGNFGFPRMGIAGAAWASTIADGIGMTSIIVMIVSNKLNWKIGLFRKLAFHWNSMKSLFKVGSPLMLQGFLALFTWTVFFTWIEQIGIFELTVSQNIRSIYFLAFIPVWGFASTTRTYISQYIGGEQTKYLLLIQKRIQLLTMISLLVIFHGAFFYPEDLISWINPNPKYIEKSAQILRMVAPSILLFGFINVYYQSIIASGNTRITLIIESICVVFYLVSSYLLIKIWKVDILYVWIVEYIYFGLLGLLSYIYLRKFLWEEKVI